MFDNKERMGRPFASHLIRRVTSNRDNVLAARVLANRREKQSVRKYLYETDRMDF